ncbi:MAG: peptidyl-prolyl cis-trans isomerase [Magnetococcales bacterium]|nr:peptidyl-prolyl cis-trans isomerase [Magnetococcales bacterium]
MMRRSGRLPLLPLFLLAFALGGESALLHAEPSPPDPVGASTDSGKDKEASVDKPFAVVGDEVVPASLYLNALRQGVQNKFYHGSIPEGAMAKFQREVGRNLVERLLLLKEAKAQGIKPDMAEIGKIIAEYEQRYANAPRWQSEREKLLPSLTQELESQSVLKQLEKSVRTLPDPPLADVQAYYDEHPNKFTKPMNQQLSLILLKVDPSAGGAAWKEAQAEAERVVAKIKSGSDFSELAKIHSGDPSAATGGLLAHAHAGTLSPEIEKSLEKLEPGAITDPIMVLEGVAIFRLESRNPPVKVDFDKARERAQDLLMRERAEAAWATFKQQLWQQTPVQIDEASYYLPLAPGEADIPKQRPAKGQ